MWPWLTGLGRVSIILMAGCDKTPIGVTSVNCLAFKTIVYSGKDTDITIRQVREHNAVMKELCPDD